MKFPFARFWNAALFILLNAVFFLLPSSCGKTQKQAAQPEAGFSQTSEPDDQPDNYYITGGNDVNAIEAAQEFRIGIQAFNRYAYNEAILSFERALSFRPGEGIIHDWLGKAYYRSGFEETALRQWRAAEAAYGRSSGTGMLIASRIETIAGRRILLSVADDNMRYVDAGRYPGRNGEYELYRQPSSVLPNEDGSAWVVANGSNEIVRIDVNGLIRDRKRGPLNGFDRPYDIARGADGRFYVSEFWGGRISVLDNQGNWIAYIGSKGLDDGKLLGPQNLTLDEEGYLYVVDYGNHRISKFHPDGTFIVSFGYKSRFFPGFLNPTGIAAADGVIYAADSAAKKIYMFDSNGSFLDVFISEGLTGPESMRFLSDGRLLVADTNRVLLIDTATAIIRELGMAGNQKVRIVCADMDKNGNILAANFDAGEISVLTRSEDMASGLFVQIRRVSVDQFPLVTVELTVQDRSRRPIVGLENFNFLITEKGRAAGEQNFLIPAYRSPMFDVSLLVERSNLTANMRNDLANAARDINNALGGQGRIVSMVSAGVQPQLENIDMQNGVSALENAARGGSSSYSNRWRFDLGLRLAATNLLPLEKKRAVIYIGSGTPGDLAFEQYGLSELAAYMANNDIIFHAVIVGGGAPSDSISFLCGETGGKALSLYRPEGISELVQSIAKTPSSLYTLNYRSRLPTDFGRAFLPVEAEVYLMERSGRDNAGYFPPLE